MLLMPIFGVFGQDKIDKLIEAQAKQGEQIAELIKQTVENSKLITENSKQIAIVATRLEGFEKSVDKRFDAVDKRFDAVDKRFDMLFYTMLALLAGIFGLVGFVFWDRRTAIRPIEDETKKEIELLKARETVSENKIKKIFEKFPDLANLA